MDVLVMWTLSNTVLTLKLLLRWIIHAFARPVMYVVRIIYCTQLCSLYLTLELLLRWNFIFVPTSSIKLLLIKLLIKLLSKLCLFVLGFWFGSGNVGVVSARC